MGARWPQAQVFGQQQRDRALTSPFAASSSPFARIPTPRLGSSLPLRKSVRPHALPLRAAPPPPPPRPVLKNPHLTPAFRASPCHHPLCLPVSYVPAHEAPSAIHLCPPSRMLCTLPGMAHPGRTHCHLPRALLQGAGAATLPSGLEWALRARRAHKDGAGIWTCKHGPWVQMGLLFACWEPWGVLIPLLLGVPICKAGR